MFVIDEADRLLEQGFEEDLRGIVKALPSQRQTALFSATQTRKVEDLARLAIKTDPVYVGVHDSEQHATVAGLEQGYVVVAPKDRFRLLFTFLKRHRKKEKVMVFFSSCNAVKYYSDLLNYVDVPVLGGVPFDTLRRGDGVGAASRRSRGRRRESRHASRASQRRRGGRTPSTRPRPRERAGLREAGRAAAAPRAPRERDVADGGADSRAQSSPVRHRHEVERAAEDATRPKPPRREQTADARGRETTTRRHQKTKKQHRSSTSTAARSSRSARRRSSSSAGRRRACCCAPTSPRGA